MTHSTKDPNGWVVLSAYDLATHKPELASDSLAYDEFKEKESFFHRPSLTIQVYTGRNHYEVDLEQCRNSAEMLDMVFQVKSRAWCTPHILDGFMDCLNQACWSAFKRGQCSVRLGATAA